MNQGSENINRVLCPEDRPISSTWIPLDYEDGVVRQNVDSKSLNSSTYRKIPFNNAMRASDVKHPLPKVSRIPAPPTARNNNCDDKANKLKMQQDRTTVTDGGRPMKKERNSYADTSKIKNLIMTQDQNPATSAFSSQKYQKPGLNTKYDGKRAQVVEIPSFNADSLDSSMTKYAFYNGRMIPIQKSAELGASEQIKSKAQAAAPSAVRRMDEAFEKAINESARAVATQSQMRINKIFNEMKETVTFHPKSDDASSYRSSNLKSLKEDPNLINPSVDTNKSGSVISKSKPPLMTYNNADPEEATSTKDFNYSDLTTQSGIWYTRASKGSKDFGNSLHHRIKTATHPDTSVEIGGTSFPCHMVALSVYSKYFENNRRTTQAMHRVVLPEESVPADLFPVIMEWILLPEDRRLPIITENNVADLYGAALFLCIDKLKLDCLVFAHTLDATSPQFPQIWDAVRRKEGKGKMLDILVSKAANTFKQMTQETFLLLDVEDLILLLDSDDLAVDKEFDVFHNGVSWLLYDWKVRKGHVAAVLSTVRFGLLSPLNLTQIGHSSGIKEQREYNEIVQHPEVKRMIDDGLAYAILEESYKSEPEVRRQWTERSGIPEPKQRKCILRGLASLVPNERESVYDLNHFKDEDDIITPPTLSPQRSYTLLEPSLTDLTPRIDNLGSSDTY